MHFDGRTKDQMDAVDHDMMRENSHSTMRIGNADRQSRVTFGGLKLGPDWRVQMANQDTAFGLRPIGLTGAGANTTGVTQYEIASNNTNAIFQTRQ